MRASLLRRSSAEFVGTAFLVAAVVGSGIMGDRLSNGNVALALLANTVATGAALVALIFTFGSISGAHFNPVVTIADALESGIPWPETPSYIFAQIVGGITGAIAAHIMFGLPLIFPIAPQSQRSRHRYLVSSSPRSDYFLLSGAARGCALMPSHSQ